MTERPSPADLLNRMLLADEWDMNAMVEEGLVKRDRWGDVSFTRRDPDGDHYTVGMTSYQLHGWLDRTAVPAPLPRPDPAGTE